jgi:hypothetical protein
MLVSIGADMVHKQFVPMVAMIFSTGVLVLLSVEVLRVEELSEC